MIPTYLQIAAGARGVRRHAACSWARRTSSAYEPGAYTGEVAAAELAEVGVRGRRGRPRRAPAPVRRDRRRRRGEDRRSPRARHHAGAVHRRAGPPATAPAAARATVAQLRADLEGVPAGAVIVAYEPVWAIGAPEPAADEHIVTVAARAPRRDRRRPRPRRQRRHLRRLRRPRPAHRASATASTDSSSAASRTTPTPSSPCSTRLRSRRPRSSVASRRAPDRSRQAQGSRAQARGSGCGGDA